MSYEKKIGLDLENADHYDYLKRLKIFPHINNLEELLPESSKEPEPKLWLQTPRSFHRIRTLLNESTNSFMIPGQIWEDKKPLVSVLADTHEHGWASAALDQGGYSLRLRFEMDPHDKSINRYDYNEKSSMGTSNQIGGLADRDEREDAFPVGVSLKDGYQKFLDKYRKLDDPTFCDNIPFSAYRAYAGYICARNEYGFAVKHPQHNVLFVFEGCEDIFDTMMGDMCRPTQEGICEWEFEIRQVIGKLPAAATKSKDAFKEYLYHSMNAIRVDLHHKVSGSFINTKSKAEVAKEHLGNHYTEGTFEELGLTKYYAQYAPEGATGKNFTAVQSSLRDSKRLVATLKDNENEIFHRCAELHQAKLRNNRNAPVPQDWMVGDGNQTINFANDNSGKAGSSLDFRMG